MNEVELRFINPNDDAGTPPVPRRIPSGTSAADLLPELLPGVEILAVKINNQILPLSVRIEINAVLEPIFPNSTEGAMIYRRSLAFLLALAGQELFPGRNLRIGHSLGNGYFYTFADEKPPSADEIKALTEKMHVLIREDIPITCRYMAYTDALDQFEKNKQTDTRMLLEQRSESRIRVNQCKGFSDLYIEPLAARTGILSVFELLPYQEGFLLRFPGVGRFPKIDPFEDEPGLFSVYHEYKRWGRIIGVHAVGHLNSLVANRTIREYIRIAETFQEKKLAAIADRIYARRDSVKTVLIAGPSSSGKTTTAKRLSVELKVLGIDPIAISLDDYYVGTDKTPLDENGQPDFECLEALDVSLLNEQLLTLFNGGEVELPGFDFVAGRPRAKGNGKRISMGRRSMLIIEGIHGLNDALTSRIDQSNKFKVYISALTQLNLDDHNRIPTSDNRLLRRIVRDYQFRGKDAAATIRMWPSVQAGERKHIFPFQEGADMVFNSALDYELAALKFIAEPQLRRVKPNMPEYAETVRLLAFLENFAPIPPQYVPGQSILREFIGDSEFEY
ncbi:nucleoside kinase [Treponema primitia]|uniref:nucleoside kinase n=1 Tax=Treponema primitia TaxID=88058 RepID=UPI00025553F3|nr:nucleoside kinase [Treponema primitia]